MARRKTNLTITEQLEENALAIESTEKHLNELKAQKKELEAAKKEEDVQNLLNKISEKGITVAEATKLIDNVAEHNEA